jgi:hypothetical protein
MNILITILFVIAGIIALLFIIAPFMKKEHYAERDIIINTPVSCSNAGILKYPLNIMIPMVEKSVAKGMDASLLTLKNILENNN